MRVKQPKLDTIAHISVRDLFKEGVAQIAPLPTFFNILPEIFRICVKVHFAVKIETYF